MLIVLRVMLAASIIVGAVAFLAGCVSYKCNTIQVDAPDNWETNMPPVVVIEAMQETGGASAENVGYNKVKGGAGNED